jgi:hypothetical protein
MPNHPRDTEFADGAPLSVISGPVEPAAEIATGEVMHLPVEAIPHDVPVPCNPAEALTSPEIFKGSDCAQVKAATPRGLLAEPSTQEPCAEPSGAGLSTSTPASVDTEPEALASFPGGPQAVIAPVIASAVDESSATLSSELTASKEASSLSFTGEAGAADDHTESTAGDDPGTVSAAAGASMDTAPAASALNAAKSTTPHNAELGMSSNPVFEGMPFHDPDLLVKEGLSTSPIGAPETTCGLVGDIPPGFKRLTIKTRPAPGSVVSPALHSPETKGKRSPGTPGEMTAGMSTVPLRLGAKKRSPPGMNTVVRARSPIHHPLIKYEVIDVPLLPASPLTPVRTSSMSPRGSIFGMAGPGSPDLVDPTLLSAVDELIDSAYKTGLGAFDDPPSAVAMQQAAVAAASPVPFPIPESPLEGTEPIERTNPSGPSPSLVGTALCVTPHTDPQSSPAIPSRAFPSPVGPLLYTTPEPKPQTRSTPQLVQRIAPETPEPDNLLPSLPGVIPLSETLSPVQPKASSPPAGEKADMSICTPEADPSMGQLSSSPCGADGQGTSLAEPKGDTQKVHHTPGGLEQVSDAGVEDGTHAAPNSACACAVVHAVVGAALGITSPSSLVSNGGVEGAPGDQPASGFPGETENDEVIEERMLGSDQASEDTCKEKGTEAGGFSPSIQAGSDGPVTPDKASSPNSTPEVVSTPAQGGDSTPAPADEPLATPAQDVASPHAEPVQTPASLESPSGTPLGSARENELSAPDPLPAIGAVSPSGTAAVAVSPTPGTAAPSPDRCVPSTPKQEASAAADGCDEQMSAGDAQSLVHADHAGACVITKEASTEETSAIQGVLNATDLEEAMAGSPIQMGSPVQVIGCCTHSTRARSYLYFGWRHCTCQG